MKRIFSILGVAVLLSLCASAQDKTLIYKGDGPTDAINLISGNKNIVAEKGATYAFVADFTKTHVVNINRENVVEKDHGLVEPYNASRGEDFVKDWPVDVGVLTVKACDSISKKLKVKCQPYGVAENPKYLMLLSLAYFDFGTFVPIGGLKDGGNIAKGILYVYDAATEKELAKFDVNYLRGKNVGYGNRERMMQFGTEIGTALKKMLK